MSGILLNPTGKQTAAHQHEMHEEYGLLMSLALDNLLDEQEACDLQRHLAACAPCDKQWQIWQNIDQQFLMPPEVVPTDDLVAQVNARIEATERRREFRVGVLLAFLTVFIWTIGFAGVGTVIGFLVFNQIGALGDAFHSLTHLWTTVTVLFESIGRALVGLSDNPSAMGVVLCYVAVAVTALAGWTRILRRTIRPLDFDSQSMF